MRIIRTPQTCTTWRRQQDAPQISLGFVPTMGALHAGHRSLIQRARQMSKTVVVSIFVNPLQFGPAEDFHRYPRLQEQDLALCREEHVDVVFIPQLDGLYPSEFQTIVGVNMLSKRWEGEHRPTHFDGVTTIVAKLLNLVRPTRTFFGQKDYQQFLVIQQMVKDLAWETKLILCPTIRDPDGLALSSRNQYLEASDREHARLLYQALSAGKQAIAKGQHNTRHICHAMQKVLHRHQQLTIDYLACCDAHTLEPLPHVQGKVVLLGAIQLGTIRLIDNMVVHVRH
ncbi:MAG: pantoate--beta-alanine ligase [Nitrospirae bacterium]|nr:pantoate--beta-alanine ligase [Nitrospirota bacterium]MDA1304830.1 pantoate--beta-alanine ligase [Nitrospirota bacterium]